MLLPNACRHPNRNGCFFFKGLSQQSDVTTLNWGNGGMQVSSQWISQDCGFFLKNPDSVRERFFGLRMCKHKFELTTFLHLPQPQSKHTHFQSCYPAGKEAHFFCLWLCQGKLKQIPFCTCHNPNPKTRSSPQQLPTNKECASTPPEAELHKLCFAQCTCSARHSARHSARPQNAVNTMGFAFCWQFPPQKNKNILCFWFFLIIFGKMRGIYSALWPCTVTCTVRALCVHCACTVQNTMFVPRYIFIGKNAAILLLEACRHNLH